MTLPTPIATSDFDILIGVVMAVGWVVMQIISKAAKNKPPSIDTPGRDQTDAPNDANPVNNTAEEMRRFFEGLEGSRTPAATPKNVPATTAAVPDRGRRTTAASQSVTASGQAVTSSSQRTAARRSSERQAPTVTTKDEVSQAGLEAYPTLAIVPSDVPVTTGAFAEAHAREGRLAFVGRLRSTKDLRQAVMMMEVLSPPLGMRRTPFPIG